MQHLSSRTLKPSHTTSFLDKWTSYLEDFRANPSVMLESVKELKIQDTSSLTSEMESGNASPELFSSKTLKELSQVKRPMENQFSNMSSENWKDWVTSQRQEYSQRVKSQHLISESESLSWPTITVNESHNTPCPSQFKRNTPPLGTAVLIAGQPDQTNHSTSGKSQESWPTPRANKVHPEITDQNREQLANRKKANLEEDVAGHCGKATGKLNPDWVEQLMGLPVGWTDLGSWATESSQPQQPKPSLPSSRE